MSENMSAQHKHVWIDHIPTIWIDAVQLSPHRKLAIWLPWFTGDKEAMMRYLTELSQRGYVALSCDPWEHGERARESEEALRTRVFGNFRRYMWPILAHTVEDILRVVDWAVESLGVEPDVYVGGISMGGDIAVAAAGIEKRVTCVAALNATPDWMRPGMDIAAGTADAYSEYLCRRLNPMEHLDAYSHCPAIAFECGADDKHVLPDGALRFQAALRKTYELCPDKLRVNLYEGVGHRSTDEMWQNSLAWFARACKG
jgi:dienelactone hydrolase